MPEWKGIDYEDVDNVYLKRIHTEHSFYRLLVIEMTDKNNIQTSKSYNLGTRVYFGSPESPITNSKNIIYQKLIEWFTSNGIDIKTELSNVDYDGGKLWITQECYKILPLVRYLEEYHRIRQYMKDLGVSKYDFLQLAFFKYAKSTHCVGYFMIEVQPKIQEKFESEGVRWKSDEEMKELQDRLLTAGSPGILIDGYARVYINPSHILHPETYVMTDMRRYVYIDDPLFLTYYIPLTCYNADCVDRPEEEILTETRFDRIVYEWGNRVYKYSFPGSMMRDRLEHYGAYKLINNYREITYKVISQHPLYSIYEYNNLLKSKYDGFKRLKLIFDFLDTHQDELEAGRVFNNELQLAKEYITLCSAIGVRPKLLPIDKVQQELKELKMMHIRDELMGVYWHPDNYDNISAIEFETI